MQWLVFDVGETLACEERWLSSWADWLGVKRGTFFAALGAIIDARRPYQDVFEFFRPGIDLEHERAERKAAGISDSFILEDLYPDALPMLAWARAAGYRVGIVGNTSAATEDFIRSLDTNADFVGSSARWNVAKPDAGFFHRIVAEAGAPPADITYIGDSMRNDVLPALALGLHAIHLARGPWGVVEARWPEAANVRRIRALVELPALVEAASRR